jgi:hypothetical protein
VKVVKLNTETHERWKKIENPDLLLLMVTLESLTIKKRVKSERLGRLETLVPLISLLDSISKAGRERCWRSKRHSLLFSPKLTSNNLPCKGYMKKDDDSDAVGAIQERLLHAKQG